MAKIRVLIVDDSALMRKLLREILDQDPEIEVVGAAPDPIGARAACEHLQPDVMTLDVEMPKMDGLRFLENLMRTRPMPVVMVSSLTERGCDVTLRALELGAIDFVTKPKIDIARGTVLLGDELIAKVKNAARARMRKPSPRSPVLSVRAAAPPGGLRTTHKLVAIGASTGGTEALRDVLTALPAESPPIVIVQHMPPVFTQQLAARLDKQCRIRVREARDGDVVTPGLALLAPGGEQHMEIVSSGAQWIVRLRAAPPHNHNRPSVDVLFDSCARHVGPNAVGVILTGMGTDGASGMLAMKQAGARTIAQDAATSVVFGMPKAAIECGAVDVVAPLEEIAARILRAVGELGSNFAMRAAQPFLVG